MDTAGELVPEVMPDLQRRRQDPRPHAAMDSLCQVSRMGH